MKTIFKLAIAVGISETAGIAGALFTSPAISSEWYQRLAQPSWSPPGWVFSPVWTALYAAMGVAAFLVWSSYARTADRQHRKGITVALGIFIVQLVLNILWSVLFFGFQSPGLAFLELGILWFAILATIVAFFRISRAAAWFLVPYLLWVSFAGVLNYSIVQLNQSGDAGGAACTQEAKVCPDGSSVGRTGPQCEFATCPSEDAALPGGYLPGTYSIEAISETSCVEDRDCETPMEYCIQSRCPFTSLCLAERCAVVCPAL